MKSIKVKLDSLPEEIFDYVREYNSCKNIAFNRFAERMAQKEIKQFINPKFPALNSFIIQNAIIQAQALFRRHKSKKVIFGGKHLLKRYLRKLISKDDYKLQRESPMIISGETRYKGNRLYSFNFEEDTITFKPNKGIKIPLSYKIGNNQKKELLLLQNLCNKKEATICVSLSLKDRSLCFTFDETLISKVKKIKDLKKNRVLGLDLNPNYIGVSILEFDDKDEFKVLHKRVYDLTSLTEKNKKKHELYQINHQLIDLCSYWKVSKVSVEELNIRAKNHSKGRRFNKLINNDWNRSLTLNNLKLLCSVHGIEFTTVNPAYSSQVGNLLYGNEVTPDMVASSIEIARRGFKKFLSGWFYPSFEASKSLLSELWKQKVEDAGLKDWKKLFTLIKNSALKYRVLIEHTRCMERFRLKHKKSKVDVLIFGSL